MSNQFFMSWPGMIVAALVASFAFLLLGLAGQADYEAAQQARSLYCEMVAAWHASGGEFGWPPFEGECE